jgi:hypothetical protein
VRASVLLYSPSPPATSPWAARHARVASSSARLLLIHILRISPGVECRFHESAARCRHCIVRSFFRQLSARPALRRDPVVSSRFLRSSASFPAPDATRAYHSAKDSSLCHRPVRSASAHELFRRPQSALAFSALSIACWLHRGPRLRVACMPVVPLGSLTPCSVAPCLRNHVGRYSL